MRTDPTLSLEEAAKRDCEENENFRRTWFRFIYGTPAVLTLLLAGGAIALWYFGS